MAAAPAIPMLTPAPLAMLMAMGIMVTWVPMEVPVQVEIRQQIRKMPGTMNCWGIRVTHRFTREASPPMAAVALAKAPASSTMMASRHTPEAPAPSR